MTSNRWLFVGFVLAALLAVVLGGLLLWVLGFGSIFGAGVDPLSVAVVVGLLGLAVGAMLANALAGPAGPQGPEGLTAADRRGDADGEESGDEWDDPAGIDADWEDAESDGEREESDGER